MQEIKNIERYGRLVVLNHFYMSNAEYCYCKCDCGNSLTTKLRSLVSGNTKSCGCLKREILDNNMFKPTHGMKNSRIYNIWANMIQRCNNPHQTQYKYYGGRGITVCDEWLKFENFYRDMKDGYLDDLTLDRKDSLKGYFKGNCRWVTIQEQQNNRRDCRFIEHNGKRLNLTQWGKELDIPPSTLLGRYRRNIRPPELFYKSLPRGRKPN